MLAKALSKQACPVVLALLQLDLDNVFEVVLEVGIVLGRSLAALLGLALHLLQGESVAPIFDFRRGVFRAEREILCRAQYGRMLSLEQLSHSRARPHRHLVCDDRPLIGDCIALARPGAGVDGVPLLCLFCDQAILGPVEVKVARIAAIPER